MQPYDQYDQQNSFNSRQKQSRNILKVVVVTVAVIIVILVGLSFHKSSGFKLLGTTPDIKNVSTITPYITFNFSEPLATDGLELSSDANIVTSTKIDGSKLIVSLTPTMTVGNTYSINLDAVKSTAGELISGQNFSFKARSMAFEELPKEQQQSMLKEQVDRPATRDNYSYKNEDTLSYNGFTADQITSLRQAVFKYIQFAKLNVKTVTYTNVSADSIGPDINGIFTLNLNISFDDKQFFAKAESADISTVRLYLYDAADGKTLIYDSKIVSPN